MRNFLKKIASVETYRITWRDAEEDLNLFDLVIT